MGSIKLDSLSDLIRRDYKLRVECADCRKVAILSPVALAQQCHKRGWPMRLDQIEARLKCGTCGGRGTKMGPAWGQ